MLAVSEEAEGDYMHRYVTVKNEGAVSAYPVTVETESARFYADDNFFLLEPGEEKTVRITVERDGVAEKEKITVSAWNGEEIG